MPPAKARKRTRVVSPRVRLALRYQDDPGFFVKSALGGFLWSKQRDLAESVRDNRKTAVRSGHGTGKTFAAASLVLWFLYSFPNSRVITTATKWGQVRDLLWHEVNQLHKKARSDLGGTCLLTRLYLSDGRYAIGLNAKVGEEEAFAGHHAQHILLVFDEASGIRQAIYDVGEGYMTTEGARWLMIGNPTRAEGEFYKAFHGSRDEYALHHVSVFDTPNFTGEDVPEQLRRELVSKPWVDERREAWGEGSMLWDVRVLGNFAKQSDDAVLPLQLIEDAQARSVKIGKAESHVLGVDVARFGSDETVIAHRNGVRVRIVHRVNGQATTETVGKTVRLVDEYGGPKKCRVVVDDDGVGGGVTDQLREKGVKVHPFHGGERARQPDDYPNRRSELWFAGQRHLAECDLDDDDQLAADLVSPRYKLDSDGRRVVEPKDVTKKRLGRSPDRADAVLMSFVSGRRGTVEVW